MSKRNSLSSLLAIVMMFALGLTAVPLAMAAEITVTETPPDYAGIVPSGAVFGLSFEAVYAEASGSLAIYGASFNQTAWTYTGFEAYMDAIDVSSNFTENLGVSSVTLTADEITPANGTLSVTIDFTPLPIEWNFTFDWNYTLSATPLPGPNIPDFESGTGTTNVYVMPTTPYTIEFLEGWNLIGMPLEPLDATIETIFAENLTNVQAIYGYNQTWRSWISPGVGDLTELHAGWGYWVLTDAAFNQTIMGTIPAEAPSLVEGWNLMGIIGLDPVPTVTYLAGSNWTVVYGYTEETSTWTYYIRGIGGALTPLQPREGYWTRVE